jgi:ribosome biogenesis GTPase
MFSLSDLEALRRIGLAQPLIPALLALPHRADTAPMRVVEIQRDRVGLHDGNTGHRARVRPALTQALLDQDDGLAVGDWVLAERNGFAELWISERVPPLSQIVRRDSDSGRRQPLVANVDTALLVMGLDHDFNLRRLERYLALARLSRVVALVLLTKADTCTDVDERLAKVRAQLPADVEVWAGDGRDPTLCERLVPWLGAGQTLVLLGSSGAGKSTLTNTLTGTQAQATGAVRGDDSRGRHTTTARSLHRCAGGACIIDTPGLRMLRLDADQAQLEAAFDDIACLALYCRFRDCHHVDEPGCAVREKVVPERLRNFHKLLREARRDQLSVQQRRERLTQWKARGREAQVRMQAKRG